MRGSGCGVDQGRAAGGFQHAVDYMTLPTHYLSANTQADLDGTGVSCPPLPSYLPTLVDFMRRHPDVGSAAMV